MEISRTNHLGMEAYGEVDTVFQAFHERSRLIRSGDLSSDEVLALRLSAEHAVCMPGSGQMNTILAGQAKAMHDEEFSLGIDTIFANSSGAAVAACLIDGYDKTDIFWRKNVENLLVNFRRNPILDIRTLARELETPTPLTQELFSNPYAPRLRVNVTEYLSGLSEFFQADEVEKPISLITASMLMGYLSGYPTPSIKIRRGEERNRYLDGWVSEPTLVQPALDAGAKRILLTTANPLTYRIAGSKRLAEYAWNAANRGIIPGHLAALIEFPVKFNHEMDLLNGYLNGTIPLPEGVHLAVIAPTKIAMDPMCMDAKLLYETQVEAREHKRALIRSHI